MVLCLPPSLLAEVSPVEKVDYGSLAAARQVTLLLFRDVSNLQRAVAAGLTPLLARQINWLTDPLHREFSAQAVIRYRHPGVLARITPLDSSQAKVMFDSPQTAVAPGQAVVFYRGDRVLGGGWIETRLK